MKLHTKHQISTQFSMISMTDILCLLLLFSMLAASATTPTGLTVELPTSQTTKTVTPQLEVTITAGLEYYVGNQQVAFSQLAGILQESLPTENGILLLQIDKSVPIEYMVQVVDIASSLHAQVSVATRHHP